MDSFGLFDFPVGQPLAARVRPRTVSEFRGHGGLLNNSIFQSYQNLNSTPPSLVLYGPPGTGKTTLARILADLSLRRFLEISAVNSSISELRDTFELSQAEIASGRSAAVLFIDEIHRFTKVQQDAVLKQVEEGSIVLIGATTENPRFALTPAIMSRALLLELKPLAEADLLSILENALTAERGLADKFQASSETLASIARLSGGDARKALTILESASVSAAIQNRQGIVETDITSSLQTAFVRYDDTGDQHYDVISAFIKSVRASDVDAALHYLARMLHGGEDPKFIARRLVILAAEDIGLADPGAVTLTNSVMNIVSLIGMPEGRIPLAEATIYLALAPKSNAAYLAINKALAEVEGGFAPEMPTYLRSSPAVAPTEAYQYPHDSSNNLVNQPLTSEPVGPYYQPGELGFETQLAERMRRIREILGKKGF